MDVAGIGWQQNQPKAEPKKQQSTDWGAMFAEAVAQAAAQQVTASLTATVAAAPRAAQPAGVPPDAAVGQPSAGRDRDETQDAPEDRSEPAADRKATEAAPLPVRPVADAIGTAARATSLLAADQAAPARAAANASADAGAGQDRPVGQSSAAATDAPFEADGAPSPRAAAAPTSGKVAEQAAELTRLVKEAGGEGARVTITQDRPAATIPQPQSQAAVQTQAQALADAQAQVQAEAEAGQAPIANGGKGASASAGAGGGASSATAPTANVAATAAASVAGPVRPGAAGGAAGAGASGTGPTTAAAGGAASSAAAARAVAATGAGNGAGGAGLGGDAGAGAGGAQGGLAGDDAGSFSTALGRIEGGAGRSGFSAHLRPPADAHARLRDLPDQMRQQFTMAAATRKGTITLQVRPEKLGRVDVKLEFGADSHVRATVTADSPEALDALKADARGLERALQDAGLRTDDTSLSFHLRGEGQQQAGGEGRAPRASAGAEDAGGVTEDMQQSPDVDALAAARAAARGGVDVKV